MSDEKTRHIEAVKAAMERELEKGNMNRALMMKADLESLGVKVTVTGTKVTWTH